MRKIVLEPTLALGVLLVNLQAVLLVATPFLYKQLLPKYGPGLIAGQIFILGAFSGCLLRNGANYLIAVNFERRFLKYIVITLVFNVIADVSLIKSGIGIAGIALGTSLAGSLLTTLVWRRALLALGHTKTETWRNIGTIYLPFIVLSACVILIFLTVPAVMQRFGAGTALTGLGLLIAVNGILYASGVYRSVICNAVRAVMRHRTAIAAAPAT
jgi:O-antigen/teichoic acid export membrane protein